MPTSTFTYNLDGAMIAAIGEMFSSIRRHNYTRLPVEIIGVGESGMALRYDSYGRRLHKLGAQKISYRSGAHHSASDRTKETEKGDEIHHTLVELVGGDEIVYLFTPAGQSITRRENSYVRVARDHLRSVRVEVSSTASISAHYSAYGESIITGGELRRAFAGYELDVETGLYNAHRRLYAPTLRLFVSVDPRLQNASPYPYCNDDPFNNTDPTGGISTSTITSIVMALVLVITVVVTIFTGGATAGALGGEAAAEAGTGSGAAATEVSLAAGTAAGSEATEEGAGSITASFALKGAAFGFGGTAASNSANLITQAAHGEHISAWQTVKSMLIEPVTAGVAGAASGGIMGFGIAKDLSQLAILGISSLAYSAISSIGTAAANGKIASRSAWENIGIQMAMAVGEALALQGSYFGRGTVAAHATELRELRGLFTEEDLIDWQGAFALDPKNPAFAPDERQLVAVQRLLPKGPHTAFAHGGVKSPVTGRLYAGHYPAKFTDRHPEIYEAWKARGHKSLVAKGWIYEESPSAS